MLGEIIPLESIAILGTNGKGNFHYVVIKNTAQAPESKRLQVNYILTRSMSLVTGTSRIGCLIRQRASSEVPKQLGR